MLWMMGVVVIVGSIQLGSLGCSIFYSELRSCCWMAPYNKSNIISLSVLREETDAFGRIGKKR
ncbi:hypothetical protein GDO78_014349 [Eleutherodactylus coqui]|uniref:Uncharacterized protein n=1 Tax=Eleutherodactylus coqui TaxID=57060 RepID=A0A8J6ELC7_ELECQ|nr:hypothetical protein GDO78_014349 [Eleutherodactylus coqui]